MDEMARQAPGPSFERRGEGARPPSTFEAVTRVQLEALRGEVSELKARVNGLLWAVVTAVVIDIVRTLLR